jgi:TolA-binding protein
MKRRLLSSFIVLMALVCPLFAQEQAAPVNLQKMADDLKFYNGMTFVTLGKYDKALEEFQEYLEIFHRGIHRHEAYRQIGDIYFNRFEYHRAQKVYRSLYEEFSDSDDGVAAYYRVGLCYIKMGYRQKASEVFNEIIREHGGSSLASQASLQIELIDIINQ